LQFQHIQNKQQLLPLDSDIATSVQVENYFSCDLRTTTTGTMAQDLAFHTTSFSTDKKGRDQSTSFI
jgi:hypothetical protein